jgi:hypothetical protein
MRANEFLIEAGNLATGEIKKYQSRIAAFIHKVQAGSPFVTTDGRDFVVDRKQLPELKKFLLDPDTKGQLLVRSADGKELISTSKLVKTGEFGGQSSPTQSQGQNVDVSQTAGKEGLPVKPPQVFQTTDIKDINLATAKDLQRAGAFKVKELYNKITASEQLNALGTYGQAIISCAKQINSGKDPKVPEGLTSPQMRALVDYAGEYLGILAMYKGTADFPKRNAFLKFIGNDLGASTLYFPSKSNTPLADSFAIQDSETGHTIYLSSKGSAGGAAPAISGLKIPEELKKRRQYKDAIEFILLCQNTGAIEQPFYLMNYIAQKYPNAIDEKFIKMLPWDITATVNAVNASRKEGKPLPAKMQKFVDSFVFKRALAEETTAGGILHYVTIKEVMRIVNAGAINNFQACVLEVLSENFVQIYTQGTKLGTLETYVLWPANVDGVVTVESKGSASNPVKGTVSFRVSK